jgi:hypothetical protein
MAKPAVTQTTWISNTYTSGTAAPMTLTVLETIIAEDEYTDTQFYADIKKASVPLAQLREKARLEHMQGKSEPFPE